METVNRGDGDERARAQIEPAQEEAETEDGQEGDPAMDDREDQGGQDDADARFFQCMCHH